MKYTILIDNIKAIEWDLNIQEAYLFAWIYTVPVWASRVTIEEKDYYFASKTKVIEDIPLLTNKVDTVYRYYKSLQEKGLINLKKVDNKDYINLTDKAKTWNNKSEYSEKNPNEVGKKSEFNSEKNPTYNIIKSNKINNDKDISSFDSFWSLYPNKVAKEKCLAKWKKLSKDDIDKIFATIKDFLANKPFETYTYPNPLTYLNQARWNDEIVKKGVKSLFLVSENTEVEKIYFKWQNDGSSIEIRSVDKDKAEEFFANWANGGYYPVFYNKK
jgi:hypothetical protein